jgi:hypothetical protein
MTLCPVVSGSRLAEDEVVLTEDLTVLAGLDRVQGPGFKIDQDGPGDVLASRGIVEEDIDAIQLKIRISVVSSGGADAVLLGDDLPELGPDLVAALAHLDVDDFSHLEDRFKVENLRLEVEVLLLSILSTTTLKEMTDIHLAVLVKRVKHKSDQKRQNFKTS